MSDKTQILLAEDEAMLRVLAVEMLEDSGFEVFEAGDGVEALALLEANPGIVLLVSDIKMPRMDGYALVEAGLAVRPDLKILLMTGYAQELPPKIPRTHKIHVLYKPFNLEALCSLASEIVA